MLPAIKESPAITESLRRLGTRSRARLLPVRISLLTYSTKPRGGVVHTLSLAEAMVRAGQDVTVWTLARGGDTGFYRRLDPRVSVRAVPYPDVDGETVGERVARSIDLLGAAFRAGTTSAADGFDVVHAQDCITANAVPGRVRTVHHLDHFTTPQLAACHERAIVEPVAHICVSAAVAQQVRDGWGIRATVIPNGVDSARFAAAAAPDREAERAAWRQRYGAFVLAVGGIEPRKGTLDLVRAVGLLQRTSPGTKLLIAGGETLFDYRDYRGQVDALVAELGVDLELLGTVGDDVLPGLVAACAVFAFPSTAEGFGLAAMEALAARRPVVVRDLPVLHEVFGDAVGYATDAEGLAGLLLHDLEHPGSADLLARAERGSALAASHSWDDAAARHLELYRSLLGAGVQIGMRGSGA